MKIKDLLSPRAIRLNAPAESKSQAIDALVELHAAAGNLTDPSAYKAAILAREGQGTTAIGEGSAVPHAKSYANGPIVTEQTSYKISFYIFHPRSQRHFWIYLNFDLFCVRFCCPL